MTFRLITCLLLLTAWATMPAFAQKGKKSKAASLAAEVCAEPKGGCCTGADDSEALNTDLAFLQQAQTKQFGGMHDEPLPFVLQNRKGNDILFNCADGQPGRGYFIPALDPTTNFLFVIQEWWGVNDHIRQEAEKYHAALGGRVNVIAVDLYDGKVAATVDSAQQLIRAALSSNRKETILRGALDYAGPGANVYTVGWCFGGMMSLQTAIMGGDRVRGCIMYYGTPEKDPAKITQVRCDVLGIFGTQDRSIPNETVDAFAEQMRQAGKKFELVRYDAVHAFANPSNPQYNREYGDDAFRRSIEFLKARMK